MPGHPPRTVADEERRAAAVAAAVLAVPGVARLDGGPFGSVASHLPGRRRIVGVTLGDPVEVAVVAVLGTVLPVLAGRVAAAVRAVLDPDSTGPVPAVTVTVSDVVADDPDPPRHPSSDRTVPR